MCARIASSYADVTDMKKRETSGLASSPRASTHAAGYLATTHNGSGGAGKEKKHNRHQSLTHERRTDEGQDGSLLNEKNDIYSQSGIIHVESHTAICK